MTAYSIAFDRERVYKESLPMHALPLLSKANGVTMVALDVNSVARNTIAAAASTLTAATVVGGSAVAAGAGVPGSLLMAFQGFKEAKYNFSINDTEGVAHNTLFGTAGLALTGVMGMMSAEGIMQIVRAAAPAAFGAAFTVLGNIFYAALAIYSAYGFIQSWQLGEDLDRAAKNGKDVEWLLAQIGVQETDTAEDIQKKWSTFARRVGAETANEVRKELLGNKSSINSTALVEKVQKGIFKQKVKHAITLLICLLGIVTMITLSVAVPYAPILFAIGAALWLTVDSSRLHDYITGKLWTWYHVENDKEAEPLIDKTKRASAHFFGPNDQNPSGIRGSKTRESLTADEGGLVELDKNERTGSNVVDRPTPPENNHLAPVNVGSGQDLDRGSDVVAPKSPENDYSVPVDEEIDSDSNDNDVPPPGASLTPVINDVPQESLENSPLTQSPSNDSNQAI